MELDIFTAIAEHNRLCRMQRQTEKLVKKLHPEVTNVVSLPTSRFYEVGPNDPPFTAVATINTNDITDEENIFVDGDSQGEALLNLVLLIKRMSSA